MASKIFNMKFFSLLISSFAIIQMATAGDADILSDFIIPQNVTTADGNSSRLLACDPLLGQTLHQPSRFQKQVWLNSRLSMDRVFPMLDFNSRLALPIHLTSILALRSFLVDGTLQVGFVGTTNKLFNQTLQTGDIFVFPKGLVHFQYNADANNSALAVSAFGSANAGTISIPNTLFTTGIDDTILAKSFKTNVATIQALKAGPTPKP